MLCFESGFSPSGLTQSQNTQPKTVAHATKYSWAANLTPCHTNFHVCMILGPANLTNLTSSWNLTQQQTCPRQHYPTFMHEYIMYLSFDKFLGVARQRQRLCKRLGQNSSSTKMSQISVIRNSHPIIQLYSCQTSFAQWKLEEFHLFRQVEQLISSCRTPDILKNFLSLVFSDIRK